MPDDVLRIANCSGFYGDRFEAPRELLEGGGIDVLTGDYLAELTMLILWRSKQKDGNGYAKTFVRQMRDCLGMVAEQGVKVVTNAGGLTPAACADALRDLIDEQGLDLTVAHIEGDDLLDRLDELQAAGYDLSHLDTGQKLADSDRMPLTANAYLGAWGIVDALEAGADIVVCPRVTDASVTIGPAAWYFGWARDDWDRLAGALVAGHVIECGAQATGGNYSFFQEVPGLEHPGFPIAEVREDGSCVITKHDDTGGLVSVGTVTAQLLYEIQGHRYLNPDVIARLDTVELAQVDDDRVEVAGVQGEPPTDKLKVCLNLFAGFRNSMTFLLTGLDIEEKADLLERTIERHLDLGAFDEVDLRLVRSDHEDAEHNPEAVAEYRVTVKDMDGETVGRRNFSGPLVELALASYPGFTMTAPPDDGDPFGVYWPALIAKDEIDEVVVLADGSRRKIEQTPGEPLDGRSDPAIAPSASLRGRSIRPADGETEPVPIGRVLGARSGDKGGNANVGVWARSDASHEWLRSFLTVERFKELIPEAAELDVHRYELPNLRAVNFVVVGLLGEGVAASTRPDPQAKGLGEFLRSRHAPVPSAVLYEDAAR